MWLMLAASDRESALTALDRAAERAGGRGSKRLRHAHDLLRDRPRAFETVRAVAAAVDHDARDRLPQAMLDRLRAGFDRAAAVSPDGAAALYSLGDPDLLAPVTAEAVAWIRGRGLAPAGCDVLEVGCGPGRWLAALAPGARSVTGVELSGSMAREAAARLAGTPNALVLQGSGRDLACLADAAFDLVLFADSFPYLVQAGGDLAGRHLEESARVLRPGGRLLVLNWAYEGALTAQAHSARAMGRAAGLTPLELGLRPFARWDSAAYLFAQAEGSATKGLAPGPSARQLPPARQQDRLP